MGICTYDDFDGAWFTIASLMLHHSHLMPRTEILLIDNHPEGPAAAPLKALDGMMGNLRYVPVTTVRSTAVRDMLFRLATGDIVVVLDSHVLLAPGALDAVLDHYTRHPDSRDLLQGPLLTDDGATMCGTHFKPTWGAGMYGQWDVDPRGTAPDGEAFDIPMQGLGSFACRRDAWPGLNPRFRGFGGEEGYLHEKVRRHGGRTLCLPAFRWVHRFERPAGIPYTCTSEDSLRNYLLGWNELDWDTTPVLEHFAELMPAEAVESVSAQVQAELAHPLAGFDGILRPLPAAGARTGDQAPEEDTETRSTTLPAVAHADSRVGRLLTHRRCVAFAHLHGWRSVLVAETSGVLRQAASSASFPDGPLLEDDVVDAVGAAEEGPAGSPRTPATGSPRALAAGYRHTDYTELLAQWPATPQAAERWIDRNGPLETWLADRAGRQHSSSAVPVPAGQPG
ncbi:glycosyltransferase family 2 protein [Streptomyces chrestomyceticus]|uniref:glycosyltransferase family 2 protein n=1 Tax=Streptomyces chrestomyceticus TaxID=68185 RepID=UPI0037B2B1CB